MLSNRWLHPQPMWMAVPRIAEISRLLRRERELAFYGDIDFIPTEEYSRQDALKAITDTRFVVDIARNVVA